MANRLITLQGKETIPVLNSIAGHVLFDPSDLRPINIGEHVNQGASEDDENWKISRVTYSGASSDTIQIQVLYGAWTDRASLPFLP